MRGLGTRLFGGSRVPVNRRSRSASSIVITPNSPVWSAAPSFAATDGQFLSGITVPVTAGGDNVTVSWVSGTISGSTVTAPGPSWISFTQGPIPTVTFDGTQTDSNDVTNLVLQATANGISVNSSIPGTITISAAPSTGLTFTYTANEGYTTTDGTISGPAPRFVRGNMFYESWYATKDGTLIEFADGAHGRVAGSPTLLYRGTSNRVGEWSPYTQKMTEVYPDNWEDHGVYGYDNRIYLYFDSIDSLVAFPFGVYDRTITDTMVNRVWNNGVYADTQADLWAPAKGSTNNAGVSAWKYYNEESITYERWPRPAVDFSPTTSCPPSGRPPMYTTSAGTTAFAYVSASDLPGLNEHVRWYNVHSAYSKQFDCAIIIGGASASSYVGNYRVSVFVPSVRAGTYSSLYYCRHRQWSRAETLLSGVSWCQSEGRSACKFVGPYVYWGGGQDQGNPTNTFFRADIRPVLLNPTADLATTFLPEKLQNLPANVTKPAMSADPYSNTILMFSDAGVFLYDIAANTWSDISNDSKLAEYKSAFIGAGEGQYMHWVHSDFIDKVAANGTYPRKTYWTGGWIYGDSWDGTSMNKYGKVRSIKVNRVGQVSYLTPTFAHPENSSQEWGTMFNDIKHQTLTVSGTGESRALTLFSGDWSGYPSNTNTTSGYKAEGDYSQSARQEIWQANIGTSVVNSGSTRFSMVSNAYAKYPWTGSAGYYSSATKGPRMPDGLPMFVDKRGQFWVGPCEPGDYNHNLTELEGQSPTYAPFYQWTKPGTNNTAVTGAGINGVALGNGWTLPPQDKLWNTTTGGTFGADYTVAKTAGASAQFGWGRIFARSLWYDATTDKAYFMSFGVDGTAKTFSLSVHAFNPDPTAAASNGGTYAITKLPLITRYCRDFNGPADNQYTGIVTFGAWITGAPQVYNRKIYFVLCFGYTGVQNGLTVNHPSQSNSHTRSHLMCLDIDKAITGASDSLEWIPFPENQNWWLRAWDGPDGLDGDAVSAALSPSEYRSMAVVNGKLVLGTDLWTKIGVDPWIQVYDIARKTWTSWQPPSDSDYPNSHFSFIGVPELNECWLVGMSVFFVAGNDNDAYKIAHGMYRAPSNAGRRIVRFTIGAAYNTSFAANESTISEGGVWTNGLATGLQWNNVTTSGGNAYGATTVSGYNDCIAVHNGTYSANQWAQGTVYRAGGYGTSGSSHEVELLLRFSITANNARGYEVLWGRSGELNIVRWNGALGSYNALLGVTGPNIGAAVDGDVLRAEISGSTITVYKNGAQVATATDTTWTDGKPGIGFWPTTGSTPSSYGWKDFAAGDM